MTAIRLTSPYPERNKGPILEVLRQWLPQANGTVLEIASGTGQHAVHFAAHFSGLSWQPTDPDKASLGSIDAWRAHAQLPNLLPALALDVREPVWPLERAAAVVCINMIHISPWECTVALFSGAARVLDKGAVVVLYGPFRRADIPTAPSNEAFDEDLRRRNPAWGLRQLEDVDAIARQHDFDRVATVDMPANNLTVVFRKGEGG